MLKSLFRPGLIFIAFAAGALLPGAACLAWMIRYLLMIMLFLVFLRVKVKSLKPVKTHWRILAANILLGIGFYFLLLPSGSDILAHAAFFTAIAPTASATPVIVGFLGGNTEFTVTAFLTTNVGTPLALTGLIPVVTGDLSFDFLLRVAGSLLFVIGIPPAAAALMRIFLPKAAKLAEKSAGLSFALWLVMLFTTAATASQSIRSTPDLSPLIVLEIAGISAVICAVNFVLGYLISEKQFRHEASQSLGQKNTMLLLYLALTFAGPLPALGPTFYVLWHNLWNAAQLYLHDRRKQLRPQARSS